MLNIEAACYCHRGKVRLNNEDNFYFVGQVLPVDNDGTRELLTTRCSLATPTAFGVFDGMGGEAYGEEAAYLAATTFQELLESVGDGGPALDLTANPLDLLEETCQRANLRICQTAARLGGSRMGATAALLYFHGATVWLCNIGDSRIYRLRHGELAQLSVDHIAAYGGKAMLTQHLGIQPREMVIEPYLAQADLLPSDRYLLCSDGLTDLVPPAEIAPRLAGPLDIQKAVEALASLALARGGRDNITVIGCVIGGAV